MKLLKKFDPDAKISGNPGRRAMFPILLLDETQAFLNQNGIQISLIHLRSPFRAYNIQNIIQGNVNHNFAD